MSKILVVDDELDLEILIKQKFRQKIRDNEYEFVFAINGNDAIRKLKDHPDIDIILSDINMPEMDGLTLLSHLNHNNPLVKAVIVSAYGDMENIRIAMNRGAFDFITKPINFEDLAVTMDKTIFHALQIRETLKAVKENNILKMYVDANVLQFMGSREFESSIMANETIDATVAFIDICGFTAISEVESADNVVKLLNNYFEVIVKEITEQNGIIDKFIGDAVLAVFKGASHLKRAAECCLAVQRKIAALPEPKNNISYRPNVSIGINTGEMISGNIGSETLRRLDFTVIGDTVNVAQRLQSAAKPGQILIHDDSYKSLKDDYNCQEAGIISLKNKSKPIQVYELKA